MLIVKKMHSRLVAIAIDWQLRQRALPCLK
jgi:hypothetical protein